MADHLFTDEAIQEAYRALMRQNRGGHVEEATWDRLAASEMTQPDRDELFDHIVGCAQCSTIWRGVLELRSEATTQKLIAPDGVAQSAWWRSPIVGLALAATLVVAIAGVLVTRQSGSDQTTLRGSAAPPVEGLMMAFSSENVPHLVWVPLSTATGYHVEVFSDDGRPVWAREVAAPPVPWPADVPHPRGTYRWRVEALIGTDVVARSRLATLEISR